MNGPIDMTFDEWKQFILAIDEAIQLSQEIV
jgi:hypothetical protein